MDTKCECKDTRSQHQAAPPYACWNPDCACPAFQPPSREPGPAGVPDADKTARYIAFLEAERALYRERIVALEEVLRLWDDHLPGCSGSPRCECGYEEACALLEVQDEPSP